MDFVFTVAAVWILLDAELTDANAADNETAPLLLRPLTAKVRYVFGDRHYNDPDLRILCEQHDRSLVTTPSTGANTGDGAPVRKVHKLRSCAIENLNEQFKDIFDTHGQIPTNGLANAQCFALGAIFLVPDRSALSLPTRLGATHWPQSLRQGRLMSYANPHLDGSW